MRRAPIPGGPVVLVLGALILTGCERSTDALQPYPLSTDPVVFDDALSEGVDFQAFLGSKLDALTLDTAERQSGTASLRVTVPATGDPTGSFAGGAFVADIPRDLTGYDALVFWAKASRAISLDVAGLGNDNTGTSLYEARRNTIALTTTWTRFVLPIPLPSRLSAERGLFFMAEGPETGLGSIVWFDDVHFERTGAIANPRPSMTSRVLTAFVGGSLTPTGTQTILSAEGADVVVGHMSGYFDYASSNTAVATTSGGVISVVGPGTAAVTAQLGGVPATGTVTVNAIAPPATPAPAPGIPSIDVISLFCDVYANVPVDTWSATWDQADVADLQVSGDDVKGYTNMVFAGIEFITNTVDASAMTHFHLDVYAPNGSLFRVKLVDFGANGVFGGGDDREHELSFNNTTTPPFIPGNWSAIEVPLASFTNLTTRSHLAQIVLSGTSTVFVDNIYLHR